MSRSIPIKWRRRLQALRSEALAHGDRKGAAMAARALRGEHGPLAWCVEQTRYTQREARHDRETP